MSGITRYTPSWERAQRMDDHERGEYVLHRDHLAALAEAEARGRTMGQREGLAAAADLADDYAADSKWGGCVAEAQVIADLAGDIRAYTWPESEVIRRAAESEPAMRFCADCGDGLTEEDGHGRWCSMCVETRDDKRAAESEVPHG